MRAKSFLRILMASNFNPFKHSQTSTNANILNSNVPEISSTNFVNVRTDNYNNKDNHSHNDDGFVDDENDLKTLSTIFGLFYIGQIFYYKSEGLRVKREYHPQFHYERNKVPIPIPKQNPNIKIKSSSIQLYYNKKRNKK